MTDKKAEKSGDLVPKIIYKPEYKETKLERFWKYVENKYDIKLDDYWKLHEWSCKNFPEFWECIWNYFGVISSQSYEEVFDRNRSFDNMEWFRGARLNYAENIFKYKDSHIAIIATDASDNEEFLTYKDMYAEICQYTASLRNMGIKKGDFVCCYMSNKKEAVLAFLATASIGAIWCAALPVIGVKAVLDKFQQISPKVMFTSGNFFSGGKEIKMLEKLKPIVEGLPSLEKVIFVSSKLPVVVEHISHIPKCCTLKGFLEKAKVKYESNPWELEYEQVPFDYPLTVSFTSGTTGLPKGVVHSHGAFLTILKDRLQSDGKRKDVLFNLFTAGWVSWNISVNTLQLGTSLCLYDGFPFEEKNPTRFWDLVDRLGITATAIWSKTAEYIEKRGLVPNEKHSLKTLKAIFIGSSITKPHVCEFLAGIKPGIFVHSQYGTTEINGFISGFNRNFPVYKGEIQCFSLGMDVKCLNEKGKEVIGNTGNLVIANPYPSLPISFLNDCNKEIVRNVYLRQYPGYWYVGDSMWINPVTKGFVVRGRCDETLKPKAVRFNCSDIYSALEEFPGLLDCVCVSQFNKQRDERALLFVKISQELSLTEKMKENIRKVIEENLSYGHVPDLIIEVPDIPYNMSGKKLNLMVKKLVNKLAVPNTDCVMNPESLEFYKQLDLGDF